MESDKAVVSAEYSDPINRARLNAVTSSEGLVIHYSGQKLRLRSEQRGNPSGHWTASWAGFVYPTPMSMRRDRRSKRPPRTGLQTICRKISQTLCRQRLSVEGSHEGGYPLHKGTFRSHQNGRQETGWGYTSPRGQKKIHRLGFHSHPHVCGFLHSSVVIGTRRGCGTCCGSEA